MSYDSKVDCLKEARNKAVSMIDLLDLMTDRLYDGGICPLCSVFKCGKQYPVVDVIAQERSDCPLERCGAGSDYATIRHSIVTLRISLDHALERIEARIEQCAR